jgi:hypothetical protein
MLTRTSANLRFSRPPPLSSYVATAHLPRALEWVHAIFFPYAASATQPAVDQGAVAPTAARTAAREERFTAAAERAVLSFGGLIRGLGLARHAPCPACVLRPSSFDAFFVAILNCSSIPVLQAVRRSERPRGRDPGRRDRRSCYWPASAPHRAN